MAVLYSVEFDEAKLDANGRAFLVPTPGTPAIAEAALSYTTTAGTTTMAAATKFVHLWSDTACRLEFGGGIASAGSVSFLPANTHWTVGVNGGARVSAAINAGL